MEQFETIIREAGREQRRVLVEIESTPGTRYERELEPYAIADGELLAYSYLRDEFRTVRMADVRGVQVTPRSFTPRRDVEL